MIATGFTPLPALAGGALIGLAATLLYATLGRIAGVSGIVNGAIDEAGPDRPWRAAFLLGLSASAWAWFQWQDTAPVHTVPWPWLVAAGLLVGIGTRVGNGCTSGHGICGLARLSRRSLVAVVVFMGCGFLTVFVLRHLTGWLP